MVKNKEDAEELTQDIFLRIYKGLPDFRGDSQLKTWIYRITVNTCITKLNSKRFKEYRNKTIEINNYISDSSINTEDILINEDNQTKLEIALSLLSVDYRQILLLFYIEEFSYKEIAEILELPIGTICTKLFRARKKLKEIMVRELYYEM